MSRTWIAKALAVALLLAVAAVAVAAPKQVREQTEATMLLTGTIGINADGSVDDYEIDNEDKVPDYVLENLAKWVPAWRFKPVLVDGKAVPARAGMNLRMLAKPSGDDKFEVFIAGTSFSIGGSRPTDIVRRLKTDPPPYPRDVVRAGGQGTAYLVLRIDRQGAVEDVVVERVNLSVYASEREMKRFRDRLAAVSLEAARDWTFTPPSTGELAKQSSWSVRVPVDFSLGDKKEADYGEWKAYLPGPYQRADWLDDDEAGSDAVAGGGQLHAVGSGPELLTPPGED